VRPLCDRNHFAHDIVRRGRPTRQQLRLGSLIVVFKRALCTGISFFSMMAGGMTAIEAVAICATASNQALAQTVARRPLRPKDPATPYGRRARERLRSATCSGHLCANSMGLTPHEHGARRRLRGSRNAEVIAHANQLLRMDDKIPDPWVQGHRRSRSTSWRHSASCVNARRDQRLGRRECFGGLAEAA
jgi:hypothetical protein